MDRPPLGSLNQGDSAMAYAVAAMARLMAAYLDDQTFIADLQEWYLEIAANDAHTPVQKSVFLELAELLRDVPPES